MHFPKKEKIKIIKKIKKKDKKDKKHIKEEEEDSSEEEEINLIERKPKDTDGTWVLEGKTDDQIIDFLESSASKHVVSSDPSKVRKKKGKLKRNSKNQRTVGF